MSTYPAVGYYGQGHKILWESRKRNTLRRDKDNTKRNAETWGISIGLFVVYQQESKSVEKKFLEELGHV